MLSGARPFFLSRNDRGRTTLFYKMKRLGIAPPADSAQD